MEIVPAQSSTTLTVINDLGQVKHQLWYKSCLVKETSFVACATAATPQSPTTQSVPVATPTGSSSSDGSLVRVSTSLIVLCAIMMRTSTAIRVCVFVLVLLASNAFAISNECHSFTKEMTSYDAWTDPVVYNFGINDSPDLKVSQILCQQFIKTVSGNDVFREHGLCVVHSR